MDKLEKELQEKVRELLKEKKVDLVIGHEKGTIPLRTRPCFVETEAEVDRLVWNAFCNNNLSVYLPAIKNKVAIISKACDIKSIIVLLQENQVKRENIIIIGVVCRGIFNLKKIKDNKLDFTAIPQENVELLLDKCKTCDTHYPILSDIVIGEKIEEKSYYEDNYEDVKQIDSLSPDKKFNFFNDYFSYCIRCYACREGCSLCYCSECLADKTNPTWFRRGNRKKDIWLYHLLRAIHISGRCIGCGMCEEVCPMNIPLLRIYRKISYEIKQLFDYKPGLKIDTPPPLLTFNLEKDKDDWLK